MAEQKKEERRILLLGKTGCGKSSLANTILGQTGRFKTGNSAKSVTNNSQSVKKEIDGKIIELIDTPGFFDTAQRSRELNKKIIESLKMCAPGPHSFLMVFKVERFSAQEEDVVKKMVRCFSEDAFKYTTIVFTYGDQLDGEKIEDWISVSETLKTLIQKCGGRVHVFDNKYWNNSQDPSRNNQYQVEQLLQTIDQTVEKNGGGSFTNGFWQQIKNFPITGIPSNVLLGLILGGIVFGGVGAGIAYYAAGMSVPGVATVGVASGLVSGLAVAGGAIRYPEESEAVRAAASEAVRAAASDALSALRSRVKALDIEEENIKKLL